MQSRFSKWLSMGTLLMVLLIFSDSSHASDSIVISIGVVPQQSATKLARLWTPVCDYLGKQTGYRFVFKTAKDIPIFEDRLAAGEYDIAYMNPYHYTVYSKDPGYRAFAKETNKQIRGIVVVKKDSPYQSIADLSGSTVAFPAPAAFAASVLPRAHFSANRIEIFPRYVSSHDSVYLTVAKGLYPAGGGIQRTFAKMTESIRQQLRILWTTPGYTPHAFAAHPRLPPIVVEHTADAMISLGEDEEGQRLLKDLKFNPIGPALDEDWDDVCQLGIELLSPTKAKC